MNPNKRPVSVTILACVYLVVGAVGFVYHFRSTAVASTRRRLGRTHRVSGDCLWSIYAPRPQLGALACARLDRIPRNSERLSLAFVNSPSTVCSVR